MSASSVIDALRLPLVGAPMAGGPSTPGLAAAVTEAGGLGSLAAGYRTAAEVRAQIRAARELTGGPLCVNIFVAESHRPDAAALARYGEALAPWAREVGRETPRPVVVDPEVEAREVEEILAAALAAPGRGIDLLTTTFGPPSPAQAQQVHAAGVELGITVTSAADARSVLALAPEVLVVQGPEAGGHRSTFRADAPPPQLPLPQLLAEVRALVGSSADAPALVAAGGVASRTDVRDLLALGADAVQIGTLLLAAEEAGTRPAHRRALGSDTPTVVTRVYSGRPARAIRSRTIDELEPHAITAYPHVHRMTAPLRAAAGEDAGRLNLWAGTGHAAIRPGTAAEIIGRLAP